MSAKLILDAQQAASVAAWEAWLSGVAMSWVQA